MNNPLSKYFRTPGMHVTLPSRGAFYSKDELELSMNGELAVFPMTASDDLVAKNPDALLNGSAVEQIISSCIPGIKNPRRLISQDMDFLLLAIKASSDGDKMTIVAKCEKCGEMNTYELSIHDLMARARPLAEKYQVTLGKNIIANLRPYDYESQTLISLVTFEERNILKNMASLENTEEERSKRVVQSINRIAQTNLDLLSRTIISIETPEGIVDDSNFIDEFIHNIPRDQVNIIKHKLKEIGETTGIDKRVDLHCANEACGHDWSTNLLFDPSAFFDQGS